MALLKDPTSKKTFTIKVVESSDKQGLRQVEVVENLPFYFVWNSIVVCGFECIHISIIKITTRNNINICRVGLYEGVELQ
jgi:hypothetical protein